MKINKELADLILNLSPQLKTKFNVGVGYSHPCGIFLQDDDDFIIYQDGIVEENNGQVDVELTQVYLIENNPFQQEHQGFLTAIKTDLEQKTPQLTNFLIDFHQWLKTNQLVIYEERQFKHWTWKPVGNGMFHISRKNKHSTTSYQRFLGDFDKEDQELESHIYEIYMGTI